MPLRYRTGPVSPTRQNSPDSVHLTDVDDSIVLSDLVRTGEASRLRRRGAVRLDHNTVNAQRYTSGRTTPPAIIVPVSPSWIEPLDDDDDDDDFTQTWEQTDDTISLSAEVRAVADPDPSDHVLYCGGEDPMLQWTVGSGPYEPPSPLPSYPQLSKSRNQKTRWTNGCGAVIHLRAWQRQRTSVWVGKDEATSAVVPIDVSYLERPSIVKSARSVCGCVREAVGCAICGNSLGIRHTPCQTASVGLFASHRAHTPPICPEGPRYWHGQPASPSSRYFYMFFGDSVSASSAGYLRPSSQDLSDANPSDYDPFERLVSPSPRPFTDGDQQSIDDTPVRSGVDPGIDLDGTVITSDPDALDKIGSELGLLPGR
ncbi:hypothetical protein V8B97DRAFT_1921626 [Scleroderma yunnanense]